MKLLHVYNIYETLHILSLAYKFNCNSYNCNGAICQSVLLTSNSKQPLFLWYSKFVGRMWCRSGVDGIGYMELEIVDSHFKRDTQKNKPGQSDVKFHSNILVKAAPMRVRSYCHPNSMEWTSNEELIHSLVCSVKCKALAIVVAHWKHPKRSAKATKLHSVHEFWLKFSDLSLLIFLSLFRPNAPSNAARDDTVSHSHGITNTSHCSEAVYIISVQVLCANVCLCLL